MNWMDIKMRVFMLVLGAVLCFVIGFMLIQRVE